MPALSDTWKAETRGDREMVMSREFDAPRELVYKAMTDPKLVPQWWGRRVDTTSVDVMDVRPGGRWRFLTTAADGDYAFRGEFKELVPPSRIVQTFEFEGTPGHISTETLTLEERGGRTFVTAVSRFANTADRDAMWGAGAETGARQSYDRLAELLARLQPDR